jgi:hypothetical protein
MIQAEDSEEGHRITMISFPPRKSQPPLVKIKANVLPLGTGSATTSGGKTVRSYRQWRRAGVAHVGRPGVH